MFTQSVPEPHFVLRALRARSGRLAENRSDPLLCRVRLPGRCIGLSFAGFMASERPCMSFGPPSVN